MTVRWHVASLRDHNHPRRCGCEAGRTGIRFDPYGTRRILADPATWGVNQPHLKVVLIYLREAKSYINEHHRQHGPVVVYKFAVAVAAEDDMVRGMAIVGPLCTPSL